MLAAIWPIVDHKSNRNILDRDMDEDDYRSVIDLSLPARSSRLTGRAASTPLPTNSMSGSRLLKNIRNCCERLAVQADARRDGVYPFRHQIVRQVPQGGRRDRGAIEHACAFDPALSSRRFRLATSDIGEITVRPQLMATL
jgi:hypothetical protein